METEKELIKAIKKGLLQWYPFKPDSRTLYIKNIQDALADMLEELAEELYCVPCALTCSDHCADGTGGRDSCATGSESDENTPVNDSREIWQQKYEGYFDYIICIEDLEYYQKPERYLRSWRKLLKEDGTLLLGMNNRLGIRYFCGDRDPYTGRNFDGVEGYRRAYSRKEDEFTGRCYSQSELRRMLEEAGWHAPHFFSVLPDLQNPCLIYAEEYLPNEDLTTRVFPTYHYPDAVFLEEAPLYSGLMENGMFHKMANAYLIECAPAGGGSDVLHVTCSMERGREKALYTIIHRSGIVEKRAPYPEGQKRLEKLVEHGKDLSAHGISVIEARLEGDACVMPYMDAEVGQVYLKKLLLTDKEQFLQKMDHFRDLILQSSDIVEPDKGDGEGAVLRRGYLDMVPLNSFYMNDTFVFYDQEFCEENYPANAIITRMVATFYAGNAELEKILPINTLFERYGLTKHLERWRKMEWDFLGELRKEKELRKYHEAHRCNSDILNANRQRMNYSSEEYQRLFVDIFRNADTRKLILFGSGNFTKKFLALYGQDYPVYAVIDNNEQKWGQEIEGIMIHPPKLLKELQSGEYKVLICIKNYLSVMRQLEDMGVREYSIFDSGKDYPRKRRPILQAQGQTESETGRKAERKKYHTGYIAGVFDLFHVGHLNMFKRAKEQCEYLIVGVVTDEGVRKYKEVEPFIPYEERAEMVRSCRYVDEVAEIPLHFGGTRDAWRLHHFDCQFSGSDYVDNPDWLNEKEFLEKHGAEMVFFPYTESTSSSQIKRLIEQKLM